MTEPEAIEPGSVRRKPTLDDPSAYVIRVAGHLDATCADWVNPLVVTTEFWPDGQPVTCLTGVVDQSALLGLLRRLNSLGLPIIEARRLEVT